MFTEKGIKPHLYLLIAGITLLILFFGYIFWFEHKEGIDESNFWTKKFERKGLTQEQIKDISHDDGMWYYQKVATCVGYGFDAPTDGVINGAPTVECPKHEAFCAGGDRYGTPGQQVAEVVSAIKKGGVHEFCPLIYSGTD